MRGVTACTSFNGLGNTVDLFEDLAVGEANDPYPLGSQERRPALVVGFAFNREVLAAVQLYCQPVMGAVEIKDVGSHWMLATEFQARELPTSEQVPDSFLRLGRKSPQRASSFKRDIHAVLLGNTPDEVACAPSPDALRASASPRWGEARSVHSSAFMGPFSRSRLHGSLLPASAGRRSG